MNKPAGLEVTVGPLKLRSPLIAASGTFGYGADLLDVSQSFSEDLPFMGAFVTKSLSLEGIPGNPMPRIIETPAGMINAIGLQNVGIDAFIDDKLSKAKKLNLPIILSIFARKREDFGKIAKKAEAIKDEIIAVELNISCPNIRCGGLEFSSSSEEAYAVVSIVREKISKPLFVKLSPNVTSVPEIALACERAGATGLTLINTILGMSVNVRRRKPAIANTYGGLSGPAIRPIAVRIVHQVRKAAKLPIMGVGGVMSGFDVLEFMMAGAQAVQIGTANFCFGTRHYRRICDELGAFMTAEKIGKLSDITGIV